MIKITGYSTWMPEDFEIRSVENPGYGTDEKTIILKGIAILAYPFVLFWFKCFFDWIIIDKKW